VVALVERQVSLSSVVKASAEDLEWLYPGCAVEDTLGQWARLGPSFCVATLGDRGAVAFLGDLRTSVAVPKVDVVDTVGAGDSFMSSLLAAMDRDGALGAGAPKPSLDRLEAWLAFAAAASAITCMRKGSDPPTRAEVTEYQKG
jgi:fructokinase